MLWTASITGLNPVGFRANRWRKSDGAPGCVGLDIAKTVFHAYGVDAHDHLFTTTPKSPCEQGVVHTGISRSIDKIDRQSRQ
jgi:hypothetical protein